MTVTPPDDRAEAFLAANKRYLDEALSGVQSVLETYVATTAGQPQVLRDGTEGPLTESFEVELGALPVVERLVRTLGLSPFERDVLLVCAGVELRRELAVLVARAGGDPGSQQPTFSLLLAAFPESHWSALTAQSPLFRWGLLERPSAASPLLTPLRVDPWVLSFLLGINHLDARLQGFLSALSAPPEQLMPPSHLALVTDILEVWQRSAQSGIHPVLQLVGPNQVDKRALMASLCGTLQRAAYVMSAGEIPGGLKERDDLLRLLARQSALAGATVLIEIDDLGPSDLRAIATFVERSLGPVLVASREPLPLARRASFCFEVEVLAGAEQTHLWRTLFDDRAHLLNGAVERLASTFTLSAGAMRAVAASAMGAQRDEADTLEQRLWEGCKSQARPRLEDLARRLRPQATWADLVVPERELEHLRSVVAAVRQRAKVYQEWGLGTNQTRGLGISALFAGASGTGKTLAAEVLAGELDLDLYHIDLSTVVSKWIGETEKNLRRIFDAAESGGALLLFDEADALFGKRSEVKDSHDRYANIEVSYLLQRMEAYRGLAILTTNQKSALDSAFLRRLRFVVQFPFPDLTQRAEIWRRQYPESCPTRGLDVTKLARLAVTGGNIRNIAVNAAFLAADEGAGAAVEMRHLLRAARVEYQKLEKTLTEAEVGGWVS